MAFNPYFRYESTFLNFRTGMMAPIFPTQLGLRLHTYATEKYSYTTTSRMYGTTRFRYTIKNVKKDDLDIIKDFWETTLDEGYNDFTVIDNKSRLLFDASWQTWSSSWSKQRGGVYTVIIDIESPVPWTLPVISAYCMQLNTTTSVPTTLQTLNHQGSYFTYDHINTQDGDIVEYSGDTNCLRKYGGVLRMTGNGTGVALNGGTLRVKWGSKINGSLSIFCQFRTVSTTTEKLLLVQIKNEDSSSELTLWYEGESPGGGVFGGRINGSNNFSIINDISDDTWYDCAITYDSHNNNLYLYLFESSTTSFTDFLYGLSVISSGIYSDTDTSIPPSNRGYTEVNLLTDDNNGGGIASGQNGYLQNVFIFDGHLTPMHFNMMRRLCYMWNNKTTEIYPK